MKLVMPGYGRLKNKFNLTQKLGEGECLTLMYLQNTELDTVTSAT